MSTPDDFSWRDRGIALACLGAAALNRFAFTPGDAIEPQPLEMQVLVALALQDSVAADPPPYRAGTDWLSLALRLEQAVVEEVVRRLERANLVHRCSLEEIQWELDREDADDDAAGKLPIAVTPLGFETVARWLSRTGLHFRGWPPDRADVDDAVG